MPRGRKQILIGCLVAVVIAAAVVVAVLVATNNSASRGGKKLLSNRSLAAAGTPAKGSLAFPSRSTANGMALCYNIPASTPLTADAEGWGGVSSTFRQAAYTDTEANTSFLQQLVDDANLAAVQLEAPKKGSGGLTGFLDAATFLLEHDVAVLVIAALPSGSVPAGGFVADVVALAQQVVAKAPSAEAAAHVGISLDVENPMMGWAILASELKAQQAARASLHYLLLVNKEANEHPGLNFSDVVPLVDAIGLMLYASMTPSMQPTGSAPNRFQSDLTKSSILTAIAAATPSPAVLVGVETTWIVPATSNSYKVPCAIAAEESFVMGGGAAPGDSLLEFLSGAAADAFYDITPAQPWGNIRFFVEESRTMLQLNANLAHPPPCWPSVDADKCTLQEACGAQQVGVQFSISCGSDGQYPACPS